MDTRKAAKHLQATTTTIYLLTYQNEQKWVALVEADSKTVWFQFCKFGIFTVGKEILPKKMSVIN